jgi:hypothetical protein
MSRRSVPRISPTDLREHADQERVDRVWQRLEASLPAATEARAPRRLNWVGFAAAATFVAFGGGILVGKGGLRASAPLISAAHSERSETDVLAAGDDARSFPLPGGGQLTLKPGSIVEVQRAGGGVTLKLVQGDATLETAAGGGEVPTVMVGDARLDAQASSTVTMSKRADNVDVGVSRGGAVVDSPSLKKNLESGENVSVPLHRQVTAANESPTPETPARRRARHAEIATPDASGSPLAGVSTIGKDWQSLSNNGHYDDAARALRDQFGGFDQAVKQANTAASLAEIRDLALKSKEPTAADNAARRMVIDFPTDAQALVVAPSLCQRLRGTPDGDKACDLAKHSPIFNADESDCQQIAAAKTTGNKGEASRLAREYVNNHADGGGRCRDEAERIISGATSDPDDAPVHPGDGGAPKPDAKPPQPPKP